MSWPETLTVPNPDLVGTLDGMPDGFTAHVLWDSDAPCPDWDGIGYVFALSYLSGRNECLISGDGDDRHPMDADLVAEVWDRAHKDNRYGWDLPKFARLMRFHGASSVAYDTGIDRNAVIVAVVTKRQADAWGCPRRLRSTLAAEGLSVFRHWAEGSVYGVVVTRESDGEDVSLWGIYDDSPGQTYLREVAIELVAELGRDGSPMVNAS
jgi:hypothetical protein